MNDARVDDALVDNVRSEDFDQCLTVRALLHNVEQSALYPDVY